MENRGKRQASSIFGGMGFYIALLICVLAAGVVGYYALLNDNTVSPDPASMELVIDPITPDPVQSVTAPDPEPAQPVISPEPVTVPAKTTPQVVANDPPVPVSMPETVPEEPEMILTPVLGETVAVFSIDRLAYDATLGDWRTHDGIDIRAAAGDAVVAAAAGTVLSAENDDRLGTTVVIDHNNGYVTTYASLQEEVPVLVGDTVEAGTILGTVGNTSLSEAGLGAHLHFSVKKDGTAIDPAEFLEEPAFSAE
ncbi:MAG: peptidoglycan DD-metalloendopeptidase family protein [Oscillospiraceae bacterium]|nr:peptidoglycan DD-metalloendopeptidase family protein [Oscillospiraceae bacterium]